MKIITFSAIKGGVGKTTLAFNYGEWLSYQGNHGLFIDLDYLCNLTQLYDIYDTKGTVANIFLEHGKINIHQITSQISLIAGDMHLDEIERNIESNPNKNMLLYMWLSDNYERLNLNNFEYIILDSHPDFSTATKNALIISDTIVSPITPSEYGYNAKFNLEECINILKKEAIDYSTRKTYVTAELFYIANLVKHNTKASHDLLDTLKDDKKSLPTL